MSGVQLRKTNGAMMAVIALTTAAHFSFSAISSGADWRQRVIGPMPMRKRAGVIKGKKTASKYGTPTEIFPKLSASRIMGYNVPSNTAPAATKNKTLFASNILSRETVANEPPILALGARQAKRSKEPPMTTARKPRIKIPRLGSVAKACTEVSTPERTKKVPNKDKEKAIIAKSAVHILNPPRFSVTANE